MTATPSAVDLFSEWAGVQHRTLTLQNPAPWPVAVGLSRSFRSDSDSRCLALDGARARAGESSSAPRLAAPSAADARPSMGAKSSAPGRNASHVAAPQRRLRSSSDVEGRAVEDRTVERPRRLRARDCPRLPTRLRGDGPLRGPAAAAARRLQDTSRRLQDDAELGVRSWQRMDALGTMVAEVDCETGEDPKESLKRLREKYSDDLDFAELDQRVTAIATPSDPGYPQKWGLQRARASGRPGSTWLG